MNTKSGFWSSWQNILIEIFFHGFPAGWFAMTCIGEVSQGEIKLLPGAMILFPEIRLTLFWGVSYF
jgi:hypothetical protein